MVYKNNISIPALILVILFLLFLLLKNQTQKEIIIVQPQEKKQEEFHQGGGTFGARPRHFDVEENNLSESRPRTFSNPQIILQSSSTSPYTPLQEDALDRIYNPLRYPSSQPEFYDPPPNFFNMALPAPVIGCGSRTTPCIGGSQIAIPNIFPPINISNRNIAPVNIATRGPESSPQQYGILQKIYGKINEVYPLFGQRRQFNNDKWDYYTTLGDNNVKVPVIGNRNNNELGTNDEVTVLGNSARFRVTMYDRDYPAYI